MTSAVIWCYLNEIELKITIMLFFSVQLQQLSKSETKIKTIKTGLAKSLISLVMGKTILE